jgi:hypothetical protein
LPTPNPPGQQACIGLFHPTRSWATTGRWWTEADLALLGTLPGAEVARRTGKAADAVRPKREELRTPNPTARPGNYCRGPRRS